MLIETLNIRKLYVAGTVEINKLTLEQKQANCSIKNEEIRVEMFHNMLTAQLISRSR
jgi:hypothetical protein